MNRLTQLDVGNRGIININGLEAATNLNVLLISANRINNLHPIAGLTNLEHLFMWSVPNADITPLANLTNLHTLDIAGCDIVDIRPLTKLTQLSALNARINRIVDTTPLASLTNLVELRLNHNRITDVTPLANLTRLEFLEIQHNQIADHSPIDALALSHFIYDQRCEMPPLPLEPRLKNRNYPSIFARWSGFGWPPIHNRPDLSDAEILALHDLRFSVNVFGLEFLEAPHGFKIAGVLDNAIQLRDELLSLNPNIITLMTVGMREAAPETFPEDSPYWIRDANGQRVSHWPGSYLMDFTHPHVQDRIVQQAIAVSKCGLYDGIFFDYWAEKWPVLGGLRSIEAEQRARDIILKRIRANTRPNFLIMGNVNAEIIPRTAPYINGGFMETVVPAYHDLEDAKRALTKNEQSLLWLDNNLREPRINGLEGWAVPTEPADSPANRRWMRALTTLSLTHSDGYVVFTEPEKWTHYWYEF